MTDETLFVTDDFQRAVERTASLQRLAFFLGGVVAAVWDEMGFPGGDLTRADSVRVQRQVLSSWPRDAHDLEQRVRAALTAIRDERAGGKADGK